MFLPPHPLAASRYHRQLLLPSISILGQTRISCSKVLVIGLGGLGSPASLYLAAAGVHTLGLVDGDTVELSNLHRQIGHQERMVGQSKVDSAISTLTNLNSEVRLVGFGERLSAANAKRIVADWRSGEADEEGGWDIVLDCTDNPATRYLISDSCVLAGKVLVSGAAQRTEGQLMVLCYPPPGAPAKEETEKEKEKGASEGLDGTAGEAGTNEESKQADTKPVPRALGPCYRCIFPVPPAPETVHSCAEVGVLGPVVGVIGVLMAMEVVKIIVRPPEERVRWKPTLLLYSGLHADARSVFRSVGLRGRRTDCVACGDDAVLQAKQKWDDRITWLALAAGRVDYDAFCGRVDDVQILDTEHRVSAGPFLEVLEREDARDQVGRLDRRARPLVVDVRENVEFSLGWQVKGSVNVPISTILRWGIHNHDKQRKPQMTTGPDDRGTAANAEANSVKTIEAVLGIGEAMNKHPLYFLCQRGNDSQLAAERFLRVGLGRTRWVGDVRGGLVALEKEWQAHV